MAAKFIPKIICSEHANAGEQIQLYGAIIKRDGQQGRKLKFAKMCNEFLTNAHDLDIPVNVLTLILGSLVEGKGVHVDSVGEFFQLYGRLEQKIGVQDSDRQDVIEKWMISALGSDYQTHSRSYKRAKKTYELPLPLFVRNVLTHGGANPYNTLEDGDLPSSIKLLKTWVSSS